MGVSTNLPVPFTLSMTHFNARMLSPYPGHMNLPFSFLRNQLTKNIFGSLSAVDFFPILIQCPK